jgi:hypothetical protein
MGELRIWMRLVEGESAADDIILRWVNGEVLPTETWTKMFAMVKPILDATKPKTPVKLWRNEYIVNVSGVRPDEQYNRYTSWSIDRDIAEDYGAKRERRLIYAIIKPVDIVCFISAFGPRVNWLSQQEMIVRPGIYTRIPAM